jgi:hypothetical protein
MSLVSREMRDQVKAYFTNQDRLQDKSHLNQLKLLNSNSLRKLERPAWRQDAGLARETSDFRRSYV